MWCGARNGRVRQQRLAGGQPARRAVDARRLDRLLGRQHRQNRWHALGQHGLAGAGRADHQQIVPAGGGDRDGPLGHLLAADVGEVFVVVRELLKQFVESRRRRLDVELAGEEGDRLREAVDGDHVDVFDDGGLGGVRGGNDDAAQLAMLSSVASPTLRRRGHRHRERAFHRPRAAVERELADDRVLVEQLALELSAAGENADGDRQIERPGALRQFGRGQD